VLGSIAAAGHFSGLFERSGVDVEVLEALGVSDLNEVSFHKSRGLFFAFTYKIVKPFHYTKLNLKKEGFAPRKLKNRGNFSSDLDLLPAV